MVRASKWDIGVLVLLKELEVGVSGVVLALVEVRSARSASRELAIVAKFRGKIDEALVSPHAYQVLDL